MRGKIINLINYDLTWNNNFKINSDFFTDIDIYCNNMSIYDKEIYYSIYNYYFHIIDDKNLEIIYSQIFNLLDNEDSINSGKNFIKVFKKNDIFLISFYYFYNKNIELLSAFYSIVIYKSFSSNEILHNKFEKSDKILHNAANVVKNFFIYFDMCNNIDLHNFYSNMISHLFPIYEYLIVYNIIEIKIIINRSDNNFKTEKFWKITPIEIKKGVFKHDFFIDEPRLHKFMNNYYLVGGYYNKVYEIFKKNFNSGNIFELNDLSYLISLYKNKWYVDLEWFKYILEELLISKNLDREKLNLKLIEVTELLNKTGWEDNYSQKIYSELINIREIICFYDSITNMKRVEYIYFPFFFDFRGRLYYYGNNSITANKILRTIYYYGDYPPFEIERKYDNNFNKLLQIFENEVKIVKNKYNIKKTSVTTDINIILILISIGKFLINKEKGCVDINNFVKIAMEYIINNTIVEIKNFNDRIEILHYVRILKEVDTSKKKYIVLKDFTASFFQHLTRLLGAQNNETLLMANMGSFDIWYDPYTIILKIFKEKYADIINIDHFNRKNTKKVIMTIPYSIGIDSAWEYFIENIYDVEKKNEKEIKILKKDFNKFYYFVKKKIDNDYFFKNTTTKMILHAITKALISNKIRIELENSCADLIYFKKKIKRIDIILKLDKNIRITKKINEIDKNEIDIQNILQSLRANWIAVLDAECLKKINKKFENPLFSIHDCMLIDWRNIDKLITCCNEVMNDNSFDVSWENKINNATFSCFIIL